ncbi:unnamed protein product [Cunninghamella blakesleeana]
MDNIPNELLQHIFSYLSQRYRSVCSTVCKKWLIATRDPLFYKTINLYSEQQVKKFINYAKRITITEKNIPIGYFVYELNIKEAFYDNGGDGIDRATMELLKLLYDCCPNIKKIDDLSCIIDESEQEQIIDTYDLYNTSSTSSLINYCWPFLTIVPFWYSTLDRSLSYHHQHNNITSLEYKMENDQQQHNYENKNIIQFQIDQQKRYRPTKDQQQSLFSIFHERPLINQEGEIEHYGKTIFFSSPSSWIQLKSLSLKLNAFNNGSSTAIYELDERVFDTIHTTCPQLEFLSLKDFFMNLSDTYLFTRTTAMETTIQSHPSLKQLHLNQCCFNDILCFDYVSNLYPNITTLSLHLLWNGSDRRETEQYKSSIFHLLTGYQQLRHLSTSLTYITNFVHVDLADELWPDVEFYQWLTQHPHQLDSLDYSYDLLKVEYRYLAETQLSSSSSSSSIPIPFLPSLSSIATTTSSYSCYSPSSNYYYYQSKKNLSHCLSYLHHLTSFTLTLEKSSSDLLHYLLIHGTNEYVSLSITSLKIIQDISSTISSPSSSYSSLPHFCNIYHNQHYDPGEEDDPDNDFFIDQWLDAFPHLKKLELQYIGNIKLKHQKEKDDDDLDELFYQLSLSEQQQQQWIENERKESSFSPTTPTKRNYLLEELNIIGGYIYIQSHHLKTFFESCPSLRILKLNETNFIYPTKKPISPYLYSSLPLTIPINNDNNVQQQQIDDEEMEEDDYDDDDRVNYMIIDIPHIHLDQLELSYLRSGKSKYISYERRSIKLIVNESASKNTFDIVKKTTLYPTVNIIINCKSIDISLFKTV